jgi:DNA polymerase-3 subunit delta'
MPSFHEIIGHAGAISVLQSILRTGLRTGCTPHALLFTGDAGIGKKMAAYTFSQTLLCQNRVETGPFIEPCNVCLACRKMASRNHPDFSILAPEGNFIKIDAIRQLQEQIVFGPLEGVKKLILIDDADQMNAAAANSLLKTLEEPPPGVLLILIASRPASLPETVLSRCQKVAFHPPAYSVIEGFLMEKKGWTVQEARLVVALTGGQIGAALALDIETARQKEAELHALVDAETLATYDRLFELAKRHADDTMNAALSYLSGWFRDVLVVHAVTTDVDPSLLVYAFRAEEVKQWAKRMNPHETYTFLARIQEIYKTQTRNINKQLALETLLMTLRDALLQEP